MGQEGSTCLDHPCYPIKLGIECVHEFTVASLVPCSHNDTVVAAVENY